MTPETTITVTGIKEALKELKDLDPQLRKDIETKAKDVMKPALDAIKAAYPEKFLSGMKRNWTYKGRALGSYDQAKAQKGVILKIDAGKRNRSTITIVQKNPWAAIIDMAGKRGADDEHGDRFIGELTAKFGQPSRVMWPEYIKKQSAVEQNMTDLVEQVMKMVGKRIVS